MKDFVLTPRAELDLVEIWEYVAQDDMDAADRVLDELEEAMYKLAQMPGMGHVREDLVDRRVISGYRDLPGLFS